MSLLKAIQALAEITDSINKAGYNCTCSYTPDNVSVDKDWLDYRLAALRNHLLMELQGELATP